MKLTSIFCMLLAMLFIASPVMAAANETSSRSVTAKGEHGILVEIGFEDLLPNEDWVRLFYNWISVMLVFFMMAMASQRNMRFFAIIGVIIAAMCGYFGWFYSSNPVQLWGLIGVSGLIAAGVYLKDTNKEKWGSGGPGNTLMNFVFLMILLQSAVGVVNTTAIWEHNTAVTPDKWQNVELSEQLNTVSNTGGLLDGLITTAIMLLEMSIMVLKMVITILLSIVAFSVTLLLVFPWMAGNVYILAALGAIQVIVYISYVWLYFTLVYKPMPEGNFI